jgi:glutaminase
MTSAALHDLLRGASVQLARLPSHQLMRLPISGMCSTTGACHVSGEGAVDAGEVDAPFTLMSVIKPFLLLHALEVHGDDTVSTWVDDVPSAESYASLHQLRADDYRPRNAMINSGAMVLASKIPGGTPEQQQAVFLSWLATFCPAVRLTLHPTCFMEVMEPRGDRINRVIAQSLMKHGHLEDADMAYEIYFRLCCLASSVSGVANLGYHLARSPSRHRSQVIRTMSHSGLYEATASWFSRTRIPAKSGVSGILFGLLADGSCLAASDPWLGEDGNPILPQHLLALAGRALVT